MRRASVLEVSSLDVLFYSLHVCIHNSPPSTALAYAITGATPTGAPCCLALSHDQWSVLIQSSTPVESLANGKEEGDTEHIDGVTDLHSKIWGDMSQ